MGPSAAFWWKLPEARPPSFPLMGKVPGECTAEGVKALCAFLFLVSHPLHRFAVLRHVEQSPGLFLGFSAPIKGEESVSLIEQEPDPNPKEKGLPLGGSPFPFPLSSAISRRGRPAL